METPPRRYLLFAFDPYTGCNNRCGWNALVQDFDRLGDAKNVGEQLHEAGKSSDYGNCAGELHIVDLQTGKIVMKLDDYKYGTDGKWNAMIQGVIVGGE